jgi:hypothetical protein
MQARTGAGRAVLHAALIGLRIGNEFGERVGREVGPSDQDSRRIRMHDDMLEIGDRIVKRLLVEKGNLRERGAARQQQRVAVRRCFRHPRGAGHAACAADILDHDLLAQNLGHARRHDPGDGVDGSTRRIGHDQGDRP